MCMHGSRAPRCCRCVHGVNFLLRECDNGLRQHFSTAHVREGWLDNETNREAARRFVMALTEAIAIFYRRPETAIDVVERWYGLSRERAEIFYARGRWIPKKPYPYVEGLERTAEIFDLHEIRNTRLEDYYDESFVRELDESGFIDALYE